MAGIILYRSKYGASEQYARMLAKETGLKRPLAIRGAVDADVYGMLQKNCDFTDAAYLAPLLAWLDLPK